ncbi:MAG: rhodanese-related sulfurtransferase [Candidatus Hydrogenedentes bacterium]|nr:rhodanese-related sulfurtransferase [Candidatus Hydrogenedentota bacterium]
MNTPSAQDISKPIVVAALYHFARFERYAAFRAPLLDHCEMAGIKGTLLLAAEGINGTIAGDRCAIDSVVEYIRRQPEFAAMRVKESYTAAMPFYRMKVRLKREIVAMGVPGADPLAQVGAYVAPEDWNALIAEPGVVLVDTRNDYEVALGTFEGALNPGTEAFTEFPGYVAQHLDPERTPRVAMFCTGGIRCERATAYMLHQGFKEVYHLDGGILNYLARVPESESKWHGECFVFDERVSVDHQLQRGHYDLCRGCRKPVSTADKDSPHFIEGVCCHRCHGTLSEAQRRGRTERHRQVRLAEARHDRHVGKRNPNS